MDESKIGPYERDEDGRPYRMINGKKIYQIEEKTERDKKVNEAINGARSMGMTGWEYLKFRSGG